MDRISTWGYGPDSQSISTWGYGDTLTAVGAEVQALWDVYAPVSATVELLWDVEEWDVYAPVSATVELLWDVEELDHVGLSVQLVWDVAGKVLLLPEVSFGMSTLEVVNKVYVVVEGSSPLVVGSATNDVTAPRYSVSPRETLVLVKSGDAAFAAAVAAAQLERRGGKLYRLTGLPVPLRYGLGIQRGQRVSVTIPRLNLTGDYPVLRVEHDFGTVRTLVDIGEYVAPRTDDDAVIEARKRIAQLEKEVAI